MRRGQFLKRLFMGGAGAMLAPRATVGQDGAIATEKNLPVVHKFDVDLCLEQIDYDEPYEAFEDYEDGLGFLNDDEKAFVAHFRAHRARITDDGEIPVDHPPVKCVPMVEWDVEGADWVIIRRDGGENGGPDWEPARQVHDRRAGLSNPRGRERWPSHPVNVVGYYYTLIAGNGDGEIRKELWR